VTPIPALGCDFVAVVTAPTCTEDGFTTHTCSRCGEYFITDVTPKGCDDDDCEDCNPIGVPVEFIFIGINGQQAPNILSVARNTSIQLELIVNAGANTEHLIWSVTNPLIASITQDGLLTVRNVPGIIMVTVSDPLTGIHHAIRVQIQ